MSEVPADGGHRRAHQVAGLAFTRISGQKLKNILKRTFFEGFPASEQEIKKLREVELVVLLRAWFQRVQRG